MIREGQIVLFRFAQTDQAAGKLRPALVVRKVPGRHDDWLICMISSQLQQAVPEFDETVNREDADFKHSGLKTPSVIRGGRLAVVEKSLLVGTIGEIAPDRLARIRDKLATWIRST